MSSKDTTKTTLTIILLSSTLTVMAGSIIGPVVRKISLELNVDPSSAGLIITTHGIFVFLLSPLVGSLIDRVGTRRPFTAGLFLYGVSGGAGLVIDSYLPLLVSRAFLGISVALIFTSVTVAILNLYEGKRKNKVMGLRGSANSLGAAIWPLVGGALGLVSWQLPFGVYLVAMPLGLLSLIYMSEVRKGFENEEESIVSALKSKPLIFVVYGLMLLTNLLLYSNIVYLPELLGDIGIESTFQTGLFLGTMGTAAAITASQYDKIKERLSYQSIPPISFMLWTAGFGLIYLASSPWIYALGVTLFGIGQGLMFPSLMLWVGDISSPSHLGRFSSYLTTFGFLGQFSAPIFLDPVLKSLGINGVFLVASLASMTGLIFSMFNLSRRKF